MEVDNEKVAQAGHPAGNGIFYPQVWFLWWHYVWKTYYESWTPESFVTMDEAIQLLETRWKDYSVPKSVTVVWRGK